MFDFFQFRSRLELLTDCAALGATPHVSGRISNAAIQTHGDVVTLSMYNPVAVLIYSVLKRLGRIVSRKCATRALVS